MFDIALTSELLLHLRDPQTVLENMFSVTRNIAIVGEPFDPALQALNAAVSEFIGSESLTIWWRHSIKSLKKMMQVAGFDPVEEVTRFTERNRLGDFNKVVLKGYAPRR
jgi:hypothetical protein